MALLLAGIAQAGCTIDRTPELNVVRAGARAHVVTPDRAGAEPTMTSQEVLNDQIMSNQQATVGGLSCSGIFCPFTAEPLEPCCTTQADVAAGAARAVDVCGVDFSATGSEFAGACWQRDQSGVSDEECPTYSPQGGVSELGCCSDEGRCGSFNTGQGLGCHYSPLDGPGEECGAEGIDREIECETTGIFGVRAEVDVSWGGRSAGLAGLTDDGRDRIVIHLMQVIDEVRPDNSLVGRAIPCGVDLPAFYSSTLCESYKPIFPDEMWDSENMPTVPITGNYQCRNPGCILTIDAVTTLLGIELINPESPWPTSAQTGTLECATGLGAECFPDHDGDGLEGLTIELLTTGTAPPGTACNGMYTYEGAPLSASPAAIFDGVRRAAAVLLGTRVRLGGSGKIADDCTSGLGAGVAEFVQSRAWGCIVEEGTFDFGGQPAGPDEACEAAQAAFMDENLPIYHVLRLGEAPDAALNVTDSSVSEGPMFRIARLGEVGDGITCADVRGANYPE